MEKVFIEKYQSEDGVIFDTKEKCYEYEDCYREAMIIINKMYSKHYKKEDIELLFEQLAVSMGYDYSIHIAIFFRGWYGIADLYYQYECFCNNESYD